MCEANAYIIDEEGEESILLEGVDKLTPMDDGMLILENIFGQRKQVRAVIKELSLVDHKIILKKSDR